jgi:hypothetical protein
MARASSYVANAPEASAVDGVYTGGSRFGLLLSEPDPQPPANATGAATLNETITTKRGVIEAKQVFRAPD